jgi:hypothetical protein
LLDCLNVKRNDYEQMKNFDLSADFCSRFPWARLAGRMRAIEIQSSPEISHGKCRRNLRPSQRRSHPHRRQTAYGILVTMGSKSASATI